MDVILPSKSRFIVLRVVYWKGLRLEKEMGFLSTHKMIYRTDIASNQISLLLEMLFNVSCPKQIHL